MHNFRESCVNTEQWDKIQLLEARKMNILVHYMLYVYLVDCQL